MPEDGGGIPWRKQDQFFNAPANGPAAIFLARYEDRLRRAQQMSDWIDETLIDPETHLVFDGIKAGSLVRAQYTYCQGVVIGLDVELAARTKDPEHATRVHRLVKAVRDNMAPDGVIKGAGGGDGGLFNGILARYLALVVTTLPQNGPEDAEARDIARSLVLKSGQAAWDNRQTVDGLPLFSAFWDRTAEIPAAGGKEAQFIEGAVNASEVAERDLSVQLSGWMLMEAAHAVTAASGESGTAASGDTAPTSDCRARSADRSPAAGPVQPRPQGARHQREVRGRAAAGVHPRSDSVGQFAVGGDILDVAGHPRRLHVRWQHLRADGPASDQRRPDDVLLLHRRAGSHQ